MSIATRKSVTVPAAGVLEPVHVAGRVIYVEESPDNTPDGVPTFHLTNGGDGIPLYSRSALAWLPSFRRFWIRGTAAAAGSTLYLLIYDDPCAEGIYSEGAVISGNPCADCAEAEARISPPTYNVFLVADGDSGARMYRMALDGSSATILDGTNAFISDIAGWDETSDRIYFLLNAGLRYFAADGSGSVTTAVNSVNSTQCGADLDKANRIVYWGDKTAAAGAVKKWDIATNTGSTIYSSAATERVHVAYDRTRNQVYAYFAASRTIRRMEADGSGVVDIYTFASGLAGGITIDPYNGVLYAINGANVVSISLVDFSASTVLAGVIQNLGRVKIDMANGKLYVVDEGGGTPNPGKVIRCDLDGGNQETIYASSGSHGNDIVGGSTPIEREYV